MSESDSCLSLCLSLFPDGKCFHSCSVLPLTVNTTAVLLTVSLYKPLSSPLLSSPLEFVHNHGNFHQEEEGWEAGAREARDWPRGRNHSDMIGCGPGSCEQSSLLIPESISEQRSGTCCVGDALQILLFVLVSLIGTPREQTEDTVR